MQVQLVLDGLIVVLCYFLFVSLDDRIFSFKGGYVRLIVFVLLFHEVFSLITILFCQKFYLLLKVLYKQLLLGIGLFESI